MIQVPQKNARTGNQKRNGQGEKHKRQPYQRKIQDSPGDSSIYIINPRNQNQKRHQHVKKRRSYNHSWQKMHRKRDPFDIIGETQDQTGRLGNHLAEKIKRDQTAKQHDDKISRLRMIITPFVFKEKHKHQGVRRN